jgi:aspartate kinase/aspartokinase/homoserine dehydrogenase 1
MSFKVVKFGGSNLRQTSDIHRIIHAIKAYNQPLLIVVSAFYGVTDKLVELLRPDELQNRNFVGYVEVLQKMKLSVAVKLTKQSELLPAFNESIKLRLGVLTRHFEEAAESKQMATLLRDEILSYGERLSSCLLNYILQQYDINSVEALPEKFGLLTDGEPGNGTVNLVVSAKNLPAFFKSGQTYVIPGFYGISASGKVNLLGRGGSDYTASVIGACLKASSVDLWKDVNGFCTADPKIISHASVIGRLSYSEAAELAYFGSKLIHPRTVEPLSELQIPLRFFNIHHFDSNLTPQTIINGNTSVTEGCIKSVACSDHFAILELHGDSVGFRPGVLAKVSTALEQTGINIKSVFTSQTVINFLLDQTDLKKAEKSIRILNLVSINRIELKQDVSLIAAVGRGINETHGIAARLFTAAARSEVNIQTIVFGASKVAMYFIVAKEFKNLTIKQIHDEFFHQVC